MVDKTKFAAEGYNISIISRRIEISQPMHDYIIEKISKIERFTENILDVVVNIEIQKLQHTVSIVMKFLHFTIQAQASTKDVYSAIDKATERLLRLVAKYKSKLQSHRFTDLTTTDLRVNVLRPTPMNETEDINDEIEEETKRREEEVYKFHDIVDKESMDLRILTEEEAVMKLELSNESVLIYRDEKDRKIRVMYRRRDDDNFGLVEVES